MKILKLWDIRKVNQDLTASEVTSIQIDTSKTVSTPFVDRESKLLYITTKGEKSIDVYDYSNRIFKRKYNYQSREDAN